ncbi:MAG: hypothetical protein ACRD2G_06340, partial [Terriglobia bacterium]
CYLACAVPLGVLTFSKDGSGIHYFFDSVLLISAVVPALLAKRFATRADTAYVIALLAIGLWAGHWAGVPAPKPADFAEHDAIETYLRENFPLHAASLGFDPGILAQSGMETPFSGLFQLAQLARRGIVSDRGLVDEIRARRFAVITLGIDARKERDPYWLNFWLTPSIRDAIERNYTPERSMAMPSPQRERPQDRFYIYVPQGSAPVARRATRE